MQERSNNSQQCLGLVFLSLIIIIMHMCVFVHVAVLCCIQVHVNLNVGTLLCHPGHFQHSSIPLSPGTRLLVLLIVSVFSHHLQLMWPTQYYSQWVGWASTFLFMFIHLYKRFVLPFFFLEHCRGHCLTSCDPLAARFHLNTTLISAISWNPSSLGILLHLPGGKGPNNAHSNQRLWLHECVGAGVSDRMKSAGRRGCS